MDKIIYTGEATEEEIIQELNILISKFLRELHDKEKEGNGYVVASVEEESGYIPYTAYSAKKSYIEKNPEIIQGFSNAIYKAMI